MQNLTIKYQSTNVMCYLSERNLSKCQLNNYRGENMYQQTRTEYRETDERYQWIIVKNFQSIDISARRKKK